jgi:NAD(P)-dependent dehydrogenase (short-subunit alcohol dehydrogenase family)
MSLAIITGASRGLGFALARALAALGWALVINSRGAADLERAARELGRLTDVVGVRGDVADDWHRGALVEAAGEQIDLLVNNASLLGPSPQPPLARYPLDVLERVYQINVLAPLALSQLVLPRLSDAGRIINVSSDAAVEAYEGWGGYGSSKAALDHLTAGLAAEHPDLRVYAVDPGDMRTQMHQEAFPDEDISDRPPPEDSVPGLLRLIDGNLPSGRYLARELAPPGPTTAAPPTTGPPTTGPPTTGPTTTVQTTTVQTTTVQTTTVPRTGDSPTSGPNEPALTA